MLVFVELKLIQRALYTDPYDQSLWSYHNYLMGNFDSNRAEDSIAPDLSSIQKAEYLNNEYEKILDMKDGAEDCKWIYQSLIQFSINFKNLGHGSPPPMNRSRTGSRN